MKDKKLISGVFRANEKGFGFVSVEEEDKEPYEIFIAPNNTFNSLNGDTVLVKPISSNNGKNAEGKIIKILKHEKNEYVGTFEKSKTFGFVVPDDKKITTDIYISKANCKKIKDKQKVVVRITKYPEKGKNAEGKIIEVLGGVDEAGVDMMSVIRDNGLPYEFPDEVENELIYIDEKIDKKDIPNRVDLRSKEIFTIDGEDAKDLDDAISIEKNEKGNYILGVHIADVSYYVKEGTSLNKEAINRGTSVYMFDRVIPMLPTKLSNGICSLNQGEDRFTLSITMEIDSKGNVLSSDVYKGIINVTRRMTYTNVTKILENSDMKIVKEYEPYIHHFKLMEELAMILKNKRKQSGSLDLNIPESKIILDENGVAIDVKKYELTFANEIIEQFMLIANEQIAEKFYWLEAPFIYRVHEEPDIEKISELNKFLFNLGYKIKASKDNIHPKAFAEVLEEIKGTKEERVISNLILRTLKLARYESENKGHFGLASKYYCHFTSPIRRYPDLFIHRVISKYLLSNYNVNENELGKLFKKSVKYAKSSSEREKIATLAEREAEDIKKAEFMSNKIGEEFTGVVSSITSFGIFVELESTIEGMIRFENLGNDFYIYDEEHKNLIGKHTKEVIKIGDIMKVKVIEADKNLRRISFARIADL